MIRAARSGRAGDAYLVLLSGVLLGYAMLGKGFAYLGLPPLYIGEIALLSGLVIFWRTRCLSCVLTTLPALLVAATMAWVLLRTLPFVGDYGFDALRDSVVVVYGGFAFILIALLLEDHRRINAIVRYYHRFLDIYVPMSASILLFQRYMGEYIPDVPGTNIPLLKISPGDPAVHLCGAIVFAIARLRKVTPVWTLIAFPSLTIVASISRGPLLAGFLPVILAVIVLGKLRELAQGAPGQHTSDRRKCGQHRQYVWGTGRGHEGMASAVVGNDHWGYDIRFALLDRARIWFEPRRCRWLPRWRSSRSSAFAESAQRTYDDAGSGGCSGCGSLVRVHCLVVHNATAGNAARTSPDANRMGWAIFVYQLLCHVHYHQCQLRRGSGGTHAGCLVLVPDRVRDWIRHGLPLPARPGSQGSIRLGTTLSAQGLTVPGAMLRAEAASRLRAGRQ